MGARGWVIGALTVAVGLAADPVAALPITKLLFVNVITVCDDHGLHCAATGPAGNRYFEQETDKIWEQAGIGVDFLEGPRLHSTHFSHLDESIPGRRLFNLAPPSLTRVDMFLVHTITGLYGEGWRGLGGLAIAMDTVMAFNAGVGRIDTIAHELGHNLGLWPFGGHDNSNLRYLMAGGSRRTAGSLDDICPDGPCVDLLPPAHIDIARRSLFLEDVAPAPVPEPGTLVLVGLTAVGLGAWTRRRRKGRAPGYVTRR